MRLSSLLVIVTGLVVSLPVFAVSSGYCQNVFHSASRERLIGPIEEFLQSKQSSTSVPFSVRRAALSALENEIPPSLPGKVAFVSEWFRLSGIPDEAISSFKYDTDPRLFADRVLQIIDGSLDPQRSKDNLLIAVERASSMSVDQAINLMFQKRASALQNLHSKLTEVNNTLSGGKLNAENRNSLLPLLKASFPLSELETATFFRFYRERTSSPTILSLKDFNLDYTASDVATLMLYEANERGVLFEKDASGEFVILVALQDMNLVSRNGPVRNIVTRPAILLADNELKRLENLGRDLLPGETRLLSAVLADEFLAGTTVFNQAIAKKYGNVLAAHVITTSGTNHDRARLFVQNLNNAGRLFIKDREGNYLLPRIYGQSQ